MVLLTEQSQPELSNAFHIVKARRIAEDLLTHLNSTAVQKALASADQPGHSSSRVQDTFFGYAIDQGFRSEAKGLFANYETSALRPDYYLPLEPGGIILEVERGKTTINNMDLLDFWKCHICPVANVLFLMVPQALRQNETMSPRNEYQTVGRRLQSFFIPGNYTRVEALFLFGY